MSVLVGISPPGVLHTVCICYFHLSALLDYQILPKFRSKLIVFLTVEVRSELAFV